MQQTSLRARSAAIAKPSAAGEVLPPKRRGAKKLPEAMKKFIWKKGQPSPNPGGRPKAKVLSQAYKADLEAVDAKTGKTNAELIAEGQRRSAIKGNTFAAKEMRETTEGRTPQTLHVDGEIQHNHILQDVRQKLLAKLGGGE